MKFYEVMAVITLSKIPNQAIAPHMMINFYSIKLSLNSKHSGHALYCWSTHNNHYNSIRIYVRVTASHILCHIQKRSFLMNSIIISIQKNMDHT